MSKSRWAYHIEPTGADTRPMRQALHRSCQPSLAIMATIDDTHTDNLLALYQQNDTWRNAINMRVEQYALDFLSRKGFNTDTITLSATLITENDTNIS